MNKLTMGQRIAARRKMMNLSQEALAEQLDISRQAVSKWESDAAIPEIDKLIALSRLYNVSVGWLLGVEAQESPVSDALSETQLKMVEEIVRRYQAPRKRHVFLNAAVWILCVAVALAALLHHTQQQNDLLVAENTAIQSQIAALSDGNSEIQGRLDRLDEQMDKQLQTGKLLRSYVPQCYLSKDAKAVDITFYFFPKLYQENVTAYLSILKPEDGVSQMLECQWMQDRYMVHTTLPLADNYRYSFLLVSDTGYEEEILESNTYFSDLLTQSAFSIAESDPQYVLMKAGQTTSIRADAAAYCFHGSVNMPRISEKTGLVPFDEVHIALQLNDTVIWEEDYSEAFLALYKETNISKPLDVEIRADLPELQESDRLILELTATTHTGRTLITKLDDLTVTAP